MASSLMNRFMGYDAIFLYKKNSADSWADARRKSSQFVKFFRPVVKKYFTAGKHWSNRGFKEKTSESLGTGGFESC